VGLNPTFGVAGAKCGYQSWNSFGFGSGLAAGKIGESLRRRTHLNGGMPHLGSLDERKRCKLNPTRMGLIVGGVLLFALIASIPAERRANSWLTASLRQRAITTLRERFDGDVQFGDLQISIVPRIVIRGTGLILRYRGRTDIPPLIRVKTCSTEVGVWELLMRTRHVRKITLEGLIIVMPPRETRQTGAKGVGVQTGKAKPFRVRVDEIVAENAELDILLNDPSKPPRVFHIRHLTLSNAGLGQPMSYHAVLTNPLPAGEIESRGTFGPWQRDSPRFTPLAGNYTFTHADLASFRGLSGILSSKGQFSGRLDQIDVRGETTTPDFSLGIGGHPMPLETQFHALVDGTNGNTMLDSVHAKLANSQIDARGGVMRVPGQRYRRVLLDAASENAKLEDFLRLAIAADKPPMTGVISFRTRIDIPPGTGAVADRLGLDGRFEISSGRFSRLDVQQKVAALSRRGRGETHDESAGTVVSDFAGKFVLKDARMTFSDLTFSVPGAWVNLDGTYALRDEGLDFSGTLRLQSKLSHVVGGWKSVLLKPVDSFFERRGAGTLLPIKITGTGSAPQFRLDVRRLF
jgi:hypothetical protein